MLALCNLSRRRAQTRGRSMPYSRTRLAGLGCRSCWRARPPMSLRLTPTTSAARMPNSLLRRSGDAMLIRAAVPDDIPQIMRLAQQSETAAHWSPREYDALFAPEAPERVALVACAEGDMVAGFVVVRGGEPEWEIENVVVAPASREQGIGRLLIEALLREARQRRAGEVFLEVRESNVAARALYAATGFKEEGRRRAYYRNPEED